MLKVRLTLLGKLTVQLYGDPLSENFHPSTTVVFVAHFTVKFFGTSVSKRNVEEKRKKWNWEKCKITVTRERKEAAPLQDSSGLKSECSGVM